MHLSHCRVGLSKLMQIVKNKTNLEDQFRKYIAFYIPQRKFL